MAESTSGKRKSDDDKPKPSKMFKTQGSDILEERCFNFGYH